MQSSYYKSVQRSVLALAVACLAGASLLSSGASAETLQEALASAYKNNPTLEAQRAQQRATDEEVPKALSGYRPTITAAAEASKKYGDVSLIDPSLREENAWGYSVTLEQPIFRGFRTTNSVKQAKARVRAGREDLRAQEQSVLLNAVTAYVNVIREQATLKLQVNNLKVLNKELQAAKDRFEAEVSTRTDVAQARAQRARAQSQLALARSNLKTSLAVYQQIIGHKAIGLRQPTLPFSLLPKTLDEALRIGMAESPTILAAIHREEASNLAIDIVKGEVLPEVFLEVKYEKNYSDISADEEDFSIVGRVRIPLYFGGSISARARQAAQSNIVSLQQIDMARVQTKQAIITAWSNWLAAKAQLKSAIAAVKANKVALEGVRQEQRVGQRTLLDVLNAEQELLNSQVGVVQTRRNVAFTTYALLQAVGRLSADKLALPVKKYDPKENYQAVRYKFFGIGIENYSR